MRWTAENLDRLRGMIDAGMNSRQVAAEFGISAGTIRTIANHHGMSFLSRNSDEAETSDLRRRWLKILPKMKAELRESLSRINI